MSIEGGSKGEWKPEFLDSDVRLKVMDYIKNHPDGRQMVACRQKFSQPTAIARSLYVDQIPQQMLPYFLWRVYAFYNENLLTETDISVLSEGMNEIPGNDMANFFAEFLADFLLGDMIVDQFDFTDCYVDPFRGGVVFDQNKFSSSCDDFKEGIDDEWAFPYLHLNTVSRASESIRGMLAENTEVDLNDLSFSTIAEKYYDLNVSPRQNPLAFLRYYECSLRDYLLLLLFEKMANFQIDSDVHSDAKKMLGRIDEALHALNIHDLSGVDSDDSLRCIYQVEMYRAVLDQVLSARQS